MKARAASPDVGVAAASRRAVLIAIAGSAACLTTSCTGNVATPAEAVSKLLIGDEAGVDYAHAKLTIDRIIDPSVDARAMRAEINGLAGEARRMAGRDASDVYKLAAVRNVIYESGPWNENRPFSYDMTDPYGQNSAAQLLHTYSATRRGNCVSMPILFLILADRLGVPVSLSTAPLHVFVQYLDRVGSPVNLETTSGAHPVRTAWLRERLPMTDAAVASGIYLRTHTRKESVVVMAAASVLDHRLRERRFQDAIDVATVLLQHDPLNVFVLLKQASAYAGLMDEEFYRRYPSEDLVPPHLHGRYRELADMNQSLFSRAEALGWTPTEIPA